jgi:hypothetical protein
LVSGFEGAEPANDERLFERGEDRLDGGRLNEAGGLPLADPDFAQAGGLGGVGS